MFESRVPTREELADCIHIDMTSSSNWNPGSVEFNISQISALDVIDIYKQAPLHNDEIILNSIEPSLVFISEMTTAYDKDLDDLPSRRSFVSNERHLKATADQLSELW